MRSIDINSEENMPPIVSCPVIIGGYIGGSIGMVGIIFAENGCEACMFSSMLGILGMNIGFLIGDGILLTKHFHG